MESFKILLIVIAVEVFDFLLEGTTLTVVTTGAVKPGHTMAPTFNIFRI